MGIGENVKFLTATDPESSVLACVRLKADIVNKREV
jgi:hypothetical protein